VYNGCHLDVSVSTYIKNADGTFTPQSSFNPPTDSNECGDTFYVNAVVVNDGNDTAYDPINATLDYGGVGSIALATGESWSKIWPGSQGVDDLLPGRIADFWWKVCCSGAGNTTIEVNATADYQNSSEIACSGEGETEVVQGVTGPSNCIEVEIVEAPGLGPVTGHLLDEEGQPIVYDSQMPATILPGQCFGIKAEITNNCDDSVNVGNAYIKYDDQLFSINNGDPSYWSVGSLDPGKTALVAWTLCCTGPGDGNVSVTTDADSITTFVNDPITVHQQTPGGLVVHIIKPAPGSSCVDDTPLLLKQGTSTNCLTQKFDVQATVTYTGAGTAGLVFAAITASPSPGWVTLPSPNNVFLGNLTSMVPYLVDFGNVTCTSVGVGNITVTATSYQPTNPPAPGSDFVTISQQSIIATVTPGMTPPEVVNICDPNGFDVTFRYYNWSGVELQTPNVTACIDWSGDGTVELGNVTWRKISPAYAPSNSTAPLWQTLNLSPTPNGQQDCEVIPEVICKCCAFDVKWHFTCTGEGSVTFYGNVTVNQTGEPVFSGGDTSEPVCIDQVWKAELWSDIAFFVQNDNGVMVEQDAMVPGNDFHVVIPVMNTGEATAENVQVYFTMSDAPTGTCTESYDYNNVVFSGDVVSYQFHPGASAWGIVNLGNITGGQVKKAVLLLHCICEGQVGVVIPEHMLGVPGWTDNDAGMQAIDENTGQAVPADDLHVPPCPMDFQQVPFRVQLENPITCQTFTEGDLFAVKALVTNGASQDLDNVTATLSVTNGNGTDILGTTVELVSPQNNPKDMGNISAASSSEITWQLVCNGGGEAYIQVSASSETPMLTAYSDVANVHQIATPHPDILVTITSPQDSFGRQPPFADVDGTYIGTGEQFAVTAAVSNIGTGPAQNVQLAIGTYHQAEHECVWCPVGEYMGMYYICGCVTPGSIILYEDGNDTPIPQDMYTLKYSQIGDACEGIYTEVDFNSPPAPGANFDAQVLLNFSLVQGDEMVSLGDIPANGSVMYTWTMVGGTTCESACTTLPNDIDVAAWTGQGPESQDCDEIDVILYPAAHLVVSVTTPNPSTPVVGNQFTVGYTVTNIGQSDAWNASVTLAANPASSMSITAGGYTQSLGTIPGLMSYPNNSVSGNFTLQGTATGLGTLTITPMGYDECGYGAVMVQDCKYGKCYNDYEWEGLPGTAIQSKFLEPASETVSQSATGTCPDVGNVTIPLNFGWNLISLPLIPNNSAIGTVLSAISGNVTSVWYFNASTASWSSWNPSTGGTLTTMQAGNGYWMNMKSAVALTENGYVNPTGNAGTPPSYAVVTGWNMMGFKSTCARTASDYLGSSVPWVRIWGYANGAWSAAQSGTLLQPGQGYWIAANGPGTIYP
jgi:hypothetical protein